MTNTHTACRVLTTYFCENKGPFWNLPCRSGSSNPCPAHACAACAPRPTRTRDCGGGKCEARPSGDCTWSACQGWRPSPPIRWLAEQNWPEAVTWTSDACWARALTSHSRNGGCQVKLRCYLSELDLGYEQVSIWLTVYPPPLFY